VPRPRVPMRKIRDVIRLALGEGLSIRQVGLSLELPFTTVGDHVTQQQAAHLGVRGHTDLLVVEGGAVESNEPAGGTFRVAQLDQTSNDWAEPFGRTISWPLNSALAAFTISSSVSSSLIRRRALVRIPADFVHLFRSNPYTRFGVFVHLVKRLSQPLA